MRYMMKERFWSWGDDFAIKDESERDAFLVDGAAFSWGDKLSLQDMKGCELAYISQTLLSWKPRYRIYKDGREFAEVVKEWSWFKSVFMLDVPGPKTTRSKGRFGSMNSFLNEAVVRLPKSRNDSGRGPTPTASTSLPARMTSLFWPRAW